MEIGNQSFENLYTELAELEEYEKRGVCLLMESDHMTPIVVSPMQLMKVMMVNDGKSNYMRDYELDEDGNLTKLTFTNIDRRKRNEDQW